MTYAVMRFVTNDSTIGGDQTYHVVVKKTNPGFEIVRLFTNREEATEFYNMMNEHASRGIDHPLFDLESGINFSERDKQEIAQDLLPIVTLSAKADFIIPMLKLYAWILDGDYDQALRFFIRWITDLRKFHDSGRVQVNTTFKQFLWDKIKKIREYREKYVNSGTRSAVGDDL